MTATGPRTLVILPPAPLMVPDHATEWPEQVEELRACADSVVAAALRSRPDEVAVVAASDHWSDQAAVGSTPPSGWAVADYLLQRAGATVRPRHDRAGRGLPAADLVVAMADGSASRGPKAPRTLVPGDSWDDRIAGALAQGDLSRLSALTDTAAAAVGCRTAAVWRELANTRSRWECEILREFRPFGVNYFFALLHAE